MSKETLTTLNTQTLIGFTEKRGTAWHYRAEEQGAESNHYTGAIPIEDVRRRLFSWKAVEGDVTSTAMVEDDEIGPYVLTTTDPTRKTIMRSDNGHIMGIFKLGYRIHQYNDWLVNNIEVLLGGGAAVGSAGLLSDGARAWVQIEMEDTFSVAGLEYRPHLTGATSMDGTLATTYGTGCQIAICDNTLSAALQSFDKRVKVRHSVNSLNHIDEVRDTLDLLEAVAAKFEAQVNELLAVKVTDREFEKFLDAHTELTDEKREKGGAALTIALGKQDALRRLWNDDERVTPWAHTAFGVVQAVNTFTHHELTVRGATRAERNMDRVVTGGVDTLDRGTLATLQTVL